MTTRSWIEIFVHTHVSLVPFLSAAPTVSSWERFLTNLPSVVWLTLTNIRFTVLLMCPNVLLPGTRFWSSPMDTHKATTTFKTSSSIVQGMIWQLLLLVTWACVVRAPGLEPKCRAFLQLLLDTSILAPFLEAIQIQRQMVILPSCESLNCFHTRHRVLQHRFLDQLRVRILHYYLPRHPQHPVHLRSSKHRDRRNLQNLRYCFMQYCP